MSATVDTTDLSYGAGGVANSRPAIFSNVSGSGLWYMVYAKSTGTYYATSSDGTSWTTHTALSGLAGHLIGAVSYQAVKDTTGNVMVAYPGNNVDGSWYMLWLDSGGWDSSPSLITTGMFAGMAAHLYEGTSTYFRTLHNYGAPAVYRTTTPSATSSTWVNDEALTGNGATAGSMALLTQGSNVVALYANSGGGSPRLSYASFALATVPGSTGFPTVADAVTDANFDAGFAACVDGSAIIHVIYRIAGTDWFEATYDGATWTTGGTVPQMADDDRYPALMCDGAGDLHLVYARYNASSDYGIGYIKYTSGTWTAQSDVVTHNATNRTSVTIADTTSTNAAMITWLEGGTTIKGQGLTVAPLGVNPVVAPITRTAVGPSSVSFSVTASGGTSPYTYQWYRSLDSGFTPDGTNDLSGETSTTLTDTPPDTQIYYYKCVVTDNVAATGESNQLPGLLYNATLVLGFIGDSITSVTGTGTLKTCEVMAERLAIWAGIRTVTVVDESVGGSGTGQWQPGDTNYDTALAAFISASVTHVMVMLGTNGLSNTPPYDAANVTTYLTEVGNIVTDLVSNGFTVVLNAPPYISLDAYQQGDRYLQAMGEGLATLADASTIYLGDTHAYTWFSQHSAELSDGVHPNVLGIQALGSLWALAFRAAFLVALLALAPASDVSNAGSWTTNTGGTSNLYAAVDEGVPFNQSDYLQSPTDPSSSTVVLALGATAPPDTNADHTVRIQLKRG